jgi:ABC-type transport system involved in multi-copper enzyme maturation permease subunit
VSLWEIFRYDLATQFRRYTTAIYAAGIVGMTLLAAKSFLDDAQRDGIFLNAPLVTSGCVTLVSMLALIVFASVAGETGSRDVNARIEPLLYTTPLPKTFYLGGRFLSTFISCAILIAIVPLTLVIGAFVYPEFNGPFRPGSYLHAYLLVGLPNVFIMTSLLFALVTWTRRPMTAYMGGAVLFINTLVQDEVVASALGRWDLARMLDPFAFLILRTQWRSATFAQRNVSWLQVNEALVTNRLLWMSVAFLALTLVHMRFRMAHYAPGRRWFRRRRVVETPLANVPITMPRARGTFDPPTRVRQLFAIAMHAYREMITTRAALLLPVIAWLLYKITPELMEVALGTPARPTTARLVLLYSRFSTIGIFVGALIAFFASQLMWRERDARENEMVDVTPTPRSVLYGGKFIALAMLIATLQALIIGAGIASQISYGWNDHQPLLYVRVLFGLKLIDALLFAAMAMVVHVLVKHKYLATALTMVLWLVQDYAAKAGIEHNLLVFGGAPDFGYSEISGFAGTLVPWLWFKAYWAGWVLLVPLWAQFRMKGALAALALILGTGGFIFYNTNVLNRYDPPEETETVFDEDQPVVTATKLRIDLHPAQRTADVRGTCLLENRSGRAVDRIHVLTHRRYATNITFDRAVTPAKPLLPNETLRMHFTVRVANPGFTNAGISTAITPDATLLEHRPDDQGRSWLPLIRARSPQRGVEKIDLETVISTDANQTAIAPGSLRRTWTERGRRYFHYATDAPIRNGFPILSGRYAVHRTDWNGVAIEVVHYPRHAWNVERFARSARASLAYYTKQFGPYPHKQLRIVEFAAPGGGLRLTGHPTTVIWSETFAYANPERDRREIDVPFAIIAHEIAHQWWGNIVVPARVEGAAFVSESLAWYSAMMVVEETFGRDHIDRIVQVMREAYLRPMAAPEVPLLRARDWIAVYRTGALAMYSLRESIGAERVNAALRRFVELHRSRPAVANDLYTQLQAVTPAETQPLLKDLFAEITFWDLRMQSVRSQRVRNGYRVTLDVEAYKIKGGAGGRETRVPMNEPVEISLFDEKDKPLYEQKHFIRSGRQTLVLTVPREPVSAGIDTGYILLDRSRQDNRLAISSAP